jgi:hypothetical protein
MTLDVHNLFALTVEQVAELCANIKRDPKSRYYLKAFRNTHTGPLIIYARDFEDFRQRTRVGREKAA